MTGKGLLLFLSAALVLGMLSGCIASEPSQAESASAAIPTETAAAPASNLDPEASVQELEASVQEAAPTGAVIPAEDCKAKGGIGSWIVLTERGEWNGKGYPVKCVKAFKVDGNEIKADTWYKLVDGCAVEVE